VPPVYNCGYSDQLEAIGPDGCVPVPSGPGLGVEYDWDFIAKSRVALHVFE
jgi:L-alanine-DL-glutamate epimerase-like enolase superfamily enzyme